MTSNTASPSAAPSDETNADADEWAERLRHVRSLGAGHFIKDFGHPLNLASALRFVELVIAPMQARCNQEHDDRACARRGPGP